MIWWHDYFPRYLMGLILGPVDNSCNISKDACIFRYVLFANGALGPEDVGKCSARFKAWNARFLMTKYLAGWVSSQRETQAQIASPMVKQSSHFPWEETQPTQAKEKGVKADQKCGLLGVCPLRQVPKSHRRPCAPPNAPPDCIQFLIFFEYRISRLPCVLERH